MSKPKAPRIYGQRPVDLAMSASPRHMIAWTTVPIVLKPDALVSEEKFVSGPLAADYAHFSQ
jgi:hypothetical protein